MRNLSLCLAAAALLAIPGYGQDPQPLGDAARQARLQKQQKDAQAKDTRSQDTQTPGGQGKAAAGTKDAQSSKAPKVITDDEMPAHVTSAARPDPALVKTADDGSESGNNWKVRAEDWKNQIAQAKNAIAEMKAQIDQLNDSIHFASGNCVAGCAQWNERQQGKQQQLEVMKAQLEDQQKRLEAIQEAARQQGYGSSVYDP
jgi:hypothetical protein